MAEGNGSSVTRAELAAHIKGIDEHFDNLEADVSEIKYGIYGIVEAMKKEKEALQGFRQGRLRAWGPPVAAALIAASVSLPVALLIH